MISTESVCKNTVDQTHSNQMLMHILLDVNHCNSGLNFFTNASIDVFKRAIS